MNSTNFGIFSGTVINVLMPREFPAYWKIVPQIISDQSGIAPFKDDKGDDYFVIHEIKLDNTVEANGSSGLEFFPLDCVRLI